MTAYRPLLDLLKLKRRFHRWTVSAPQVTIRQRMPTSARAAIAVAVLAGVAGIAFGSYDLGRATGGPGSVQAGATAVPVDEQVAQIQAERDHYASAANAAESRINIERSVQRQLAEQVQSLETENSKLKEDLAFFESLLPADRSGGSVSIRRLKAEVVGTGQLRYRLLVMQGGKADRDFNGSLQLAVTVLQNGKNAVLLFPDAGHKDQVDVGKFQLDFKRYQRIEGLLTLPPGAEMKSVQARILEKGLLKAQQTALLEGDS